MAEACESRTHTMLTLTYCVRRLVWRGKLQATKGTYSEAVLPLTGALAEVVKAHVGTLPKGQDFLFLTIRRTLFIAENRTAES